MVAQRSLDEVFGIFEDPYNLAKITPSWLSFQVVSTNRVTMKQGAEIEYRIRWLGLPMHWKTVITEYRPPHLFVDEQAKGPYSYWRHQHTFKETSQGVVIGDHLRYALPLGILGRIAHGVMVSKQLRSVFEYRQERLAKLFGGDAKTTVAPTIRD